MVWQYFLISFSAIIFFVFVILGIKVFGWQSCYSDYGPLWGKKFPELGQFNIWSVITIFSALLIVPVILTLGLGNPWQFLGFLAPMSITLVGASPNYNTDKFQWWIHQIGAWSAVVFILAYIYFIHHLLLIVIPYIIIAIIEAVITSSDEKNTLLFWLEMAIYFTVYCTLFITI